MFSSIKKIFKNFQGNQSNKAIIIDPKLDCILQFIKMEDNRYRIEFFISELNEWWIIPSQRVYKFGTWSFDQKGSYGINNSDYMLVEYDLIDIVRKKFKTFGDIQLFFDKINKEFVEYQEYLNERQQYPMIVT